MIVKCIYFSLIDYLRSLVDMHVLLLFLLDLLLIFCLTYFVITTILFSNSSLKGVHDHVKCFHCDGGLRNWEPSDDPWLEHAQWFPRCGYLILVKGDQYIKDVAESRPSPSAALRCSRSNPPPVPLVTCQRSTPREVSEEELRYLLDSSIAQTVLSMGVDFSRVKQAIQYKMRATGRPFSTVDSLLEAAIEVQHYSEHRQAMENPK